MTKPIDVETCIIGAGPVGATLAAALAAGGVRTAVVDAAPLPPMELPAFDGRAYAIALTSKRLLAAAGVWDRLPEEPCPILAIRVADGRPGERASRLSLHFDHAEVGEDPFGWMVEARALRVALNARLPALPGLSVFAPAQATVERSALGAIIRLSSGQEIHARLVVGAEGRNSPLRREAGIPATRLDYHCMGIVGAVAHEKPHHNVALEQFLPHGPFAQLPMQGIPGHPNVSAIVWTERTAIAKAALAMDDPAYGRQIAARMGDHLGAVTPIGRRWSYPLSAMHAERYVAERLALVGDAAHGIHPIAGQGLNLGFRDVAALAELVIEAVNAGEDPGAAALLARYQAARRPDGLLMLGATHALERLFTSRLPPVRLARRLGIAAVDRMPRLKRFFAQRAMGFGSTTGGLLGGQTLAGAD
ncbi:UbiH/UbiF/VisC/COQ6 family ubiquinone biosynthesis hydroxylase [Neoroseomonas oryzicola]|uniref:UbiH/UbiF/VisC/COQ6 family ubiquinone biosynthesis hydroxylase n=1 Tax=Neoroseomonas oryzicola TaxID=535904 RepID=A0A9X9WQ51_9PROT|nr:UbiH/UbiF/VisC/COQ6 family ubiquinone biosynthesis hydroxylase [Neoroseomonas oryzicola]MBR0662461.1 UbiH/UbiF/VisC/COQ6 family ubiquinone biosynthesis hydroxylase [Neoroseomonas oryzicola]NKE19495.1 UbiH/UbiF/VisC/COQ6 family ubiquinone biosynthesis hydroxylase [Neoroseomonas oryzicola]